MALCDRGHPSASSPGPALSYSLGAAFSSPPVPIAIWEKAGGVSPPRVSRDTPSLKAWMKKNQKNKVMTRIVASLAVKSSRSSSPGRSRLGPHSLPPGAATNDHVDPISLPRTSSAGPNATQR